MGYFFACYIIDKNISGNQLVKRLWFMATLTKDWLHGGILCISKGCIFGSLKIHCDSKRANPRIWPVHTSSHINCVFPSVSVALCWTCLWQKGFSLNFLEGFSKAEPLKNECLQLELVSLEEEEHSYKMSPVFCLCVCVCFRAVS